MNVGEMVKVYGQDERGRIVDGMSGEIVSLSVFYAYVALRSWAGEVVRVERIRLVPLDPTPKSAAQARREMRDDATGRNARMLARMQARRAA